MNVMFFISDMRGGGAQRVMANITNEFVRRGHNVTIISNIEGSCYKLDNRVKLLNPIHKAAKNEEPILAKYKRNIFNIRKRIQFIRNIIQSESPDYIVTFMHCNMSSILFYHGNIPIIHSEHNAYDRNLGLKGYINRFFLNRFFDKVFVLNSFDMGYATAKGLTNTVVMPNPNSYESISEEQYTMSLHNRKNILACGRVNSWRIKGFDIAIEIFARIAPLFPNVDLDIAGYGDEQPIQHLTELAKKLGIDKRVHFLGYCNDIQAVMQQHKLLLLSSRTEGFPMVITEAMTQGLPCIAFERLASSIIIHDVDGILVKDGNIDEMADRMISILKNTNKMKIMGLKASENVTRFSVSAIADKWESEMNMLKKEAEREK